MYSRESIRFCSLVELLLIVDDFILFVLSLDVFFWYNRRFTVLYFAVIIEKPIAMI